MYDLNIEWLEWCFASLPYIRIFSQELPSCLISGRAAAAAAVARRATATSCSGTVQTAGPRLSAGPSCYPRSPSWQSDGFWGEWANWKIHLPCPGQLVWICWSVLIIFCVPTSAVVRARVCRNFWTAKPNPHVLSESFKMAQWERHHFSTLPRWFPLKWVVAFRERSWC